MLLQLAELLKGHGWPGWEGRWTARKVHVVGAAPPCSWVRELLRWFVLLLDLCSEWLSVLQAVHQALVSWRHCDERCYVSVPEMVFFSLCFAA